jgi:hypothetical protein
MDSGASIPSLSVYFDPSCPWAWTTSQWINELARQGAVAPVWRPFSLLVLNADRYESLGTHSDLITSHAIGHKLLRIAVAIGVDDHNAEVWRYYMAIGRAIHHERGFRRMNQLSTLDSWLSTNGFAPALADAVTARDYDEAIVASTQHALALAGDDVGTPILAFEHEGTPVGFFGPVIAHVPTGEDALRLWRAFRELASFPDLYEIKRAVRTTPDFTHGGHNGL